MAVGFGDEETAILVANPSGDRLEVHALLNGVADEVMPQAVVGEVRQFGAFTGVLDCRAGGADVHDPVFRGGCGIGFRL